MRASLILISGIIVLSLAVARALSCVCSPLECDVLTEEDCPGGLTWDPCRCCKVCARVEGEPCGGLFGFSGSCAVGLQCVIKNLRPPDELDEGTCSKIPGRWRRHCPHGPKMSGAGCNLIGDGTSSDSGKSENTARCVCGPSVPWCPGEPHPYTFVSRHECKINLAAKIAYDDLFNGPERHASDGMHGITCPEDSIPTENGECKCVSPCPPNKCRQGERPFQVRPASPDTPGTCCPIYNCIPSEQVSWDNTDETHLSKGCVDDTGVPRSIGEHWNQGPCVNCTCDESNSIGTLSCHATMCKTCEYAVPVAPGECCPHCPDTGNDTHTSTVNASTTTIQPVVPNVDCDTIVNCKLPCRLGDVDDDIDGCRICQCPEDDDENTTVRPDAVDKICPELPHCGLNCVLVKDQGGCPVCACEDSIEPDNSVIPVNVPPPPPPPPLLSNEEEDDTGGIICPELKCDLHCVHGLVMDENDCTVCQCKPQAIGCTAVTGCKKKCPYGYKLNRRGCLTCRCRATCTDHQNETHPEGTSWQPDVCTSCTCDTLGRLLCKETVCSVACTNPLPPKHGTCCPVCPIIENTNKNEHQVPRGWGIIPITLIAVLTLLVLLLMIYVARGRFRGRLSPSTTIYASYPAQYYKCVPAYDTPVHRNEKVVPL